MTATVVIPTRGTSPYLRASVGNALRAAAVAGSDTEVLVVVNGRADAPALVGVDSPQLRVLSLPSANLSRARNVGIAEARHDTVLFGDDGAEGVESWCVDLTEALRDPRYPVITGPTRVPVVGPVTAYLNHQRVFDAPPLDAIRARTVTGFCGLRRDRLPASVRYDESNLPYVGEDVAFGHAVRAAGIEIKWLADVAPALHVLPDGIAEITERMLRYGEAAALVWQRNRRDVIAPADVVALYARMSAAGSGAYRGFTEIRDPGLRAAFVVYEHLYDLSFIIGYLGTVREQSPPMTVDRDGLRAAWAEIADRAAAGASVAAGQAPTADFALLDRAMPADEPMIADIKASLHRFAPLPLPPCSPAPPVTSGPGESQAAAPDRKLVHDMWRRLRAAGGPVSGDVLDGAARAVGSGFRDACVVIERAAMRRNAGRAASGPQS